MVWLHGHLWATEDVINKTPGIMVGIDLFHVTWRCRIILTVRIMVGKRFLKIAVDCVDSLLRGKELSDSEVESLKASLASKKVQDLWKIAVEVSVRLAGSVQKNDIVDKLIGMAKIGVTHKPSDDYSDDDCEASLAISYIT